MEENTPQKQTNKQTENKQTNFIFLLWLSANRHLCKFFLNKLLVCEAKGVTQHIWHDPVSVILGALFFNLLVTGISLLFQKLSRVV